MSHLRSDLLVHQLWTGTEVNDLLTLGNVTCFGKLDRRLDCKVPLELETLLFSEEAHAVGTSEILSSFSSPETPNFVAIQFC